MVLFMMKISELINSAAPRHGHAGPRWARGRYPDGGHVLQVRDLDRLLPHRHDLAPGPLQRDRSASARPVNVVMHF